MVIHGTDTNCEMGFLMMDDAIPQRQVLLILLLTVVKQPLRSQTTKSKVDP